MADRPSPRPGGRLARSLASVGGIGHLPAAPGTFGTLVALPLGVPLLRRPRALLLLAAAVSGLGVPAIHRAGGGADHGWIVIDEVAGTLLTLSGLCALPGLPAPAGRARLAAAAAAFALFRVLDIAKPGPVGRLDRRHDAIGVMADDLAAGALGGGTLLAARLLLRAFSRSRPRR